MPNENESNRRKNNSKLRRELMEIAINSARKHGKMANHRKDKLSEESK